MILMGTLTCLGSYTVFYLKDASWSACSYGNSVSVSIQNPAQAIAAACLAC